MHRIPDPGTINHMDGALAVNRRFVPEPTVKYNVGTRYNRLIERRGASLDLEAALNKSRFHETLKNKCVTSVNPSFADAQHLRPGRRAHQHHQRLSVLVTNKFPG